MSKDPAFLFYSSDFLTGTAFMSYEQKGKYITLLCLQHQHGHLTIDQITAISSDNIILDKFIKTDDGKFHNIRLHDEIIRRKAFCESRRQSRMVGVAKQRTSNVRQPYVERTETENENENKDINKKEKGKRIVKEKGKTERFEKPMVEQIKQYCQERKNIIDPETFFDYYEANGWRVGKNPMSSWKAAVRTWEKKNKTTKSKLSGLTTTGLDPERYPGIVAWLEEKTAEREAKKNGRE